MRRSPLWFDVGYLQFRRRWLSIQRDVPLISVLAAKARRPWATGLLFLGLLVAGFSAFGPAAAAVDGDESNVPLNPVQELTPDVVVQLTDSDAFETDFASLSSEVGGLPGVAWVAGDLTNVPRPNLMVGFESGADRIGLRALDELVADRAENQDIVIGGRAVVDRAVGDRVARGIFVVVILAGLTSGGLVAWLIRPQHGVVVGTTVLLTGWLSEPLGAKAAGLFDGSLATTPVPAVLAALLVSVFLCHRLLAWFADPVGEDLADMIRRSVYSLGSELLLFFAALVVVELFLELVGPARSVATGVLVGVITATLLTLAVVPPVLAGLHGAGIEAIPVDTPEGHPRAVVRSFFASRPNGRQFPIAVILAFGFFFGFLGLLAISTRTTPALLDQAVLGDGEGNSDVFTERLQAGGGDPTAAILAVFPTGTDQLAKLAWLQRVSQLPSVGRIDTSAARYRSGDEIPIDGLPLGSFAVDAEGDEAPGFALIVPMTTARSETALALVDAVRATNAPVDAQLSGAAVDSRTAAERDRSLVWLTIVALALVGGVVVFGLAGDPGLAGLVAGLRLLESMAVVGLYHLVANSVSGPELLLVVFVTSLGSTFFELGFLRRLLLDHRTEDTEALVDDALNHEGWAAAVALFVVAVSSLGLIVAGAPALTRLGIVMILAVGVEIVVGLWLLRPVLLGTKAISHLAAQPVREALRRLTGASGQGDEEFQHWVNVMTELLHAEFEFQADPGLASMEAVFVGDTALFRRAVEHHQSLASAELRIIGRSPQLRTLQVAATSPQTTLAVTVDHPVRQLVDQTGKIVGVRKAERRTAMLWLAPMSDGSHRIADSVELGAVPLAPEEESMSAFAPVAHVSLE